METDSARKLVALYARVSSEEQREGQTIDSQIAELERFARDKSWEIAGLYKDNGWSGALLARPELERLRDDASKGLFNCVLINDVDRLARDVTHLGVIKRDLERRGIQVIFRKLPAENSPTHNLMVNILGSFAEFERELISDRTRRGKRHKIEVRKQFVGTLAPYGFRYIRKDRAAGKEGVLEINPEEASIVKQIYAWVADEGLSARKVVVRLNKSGLCPRKGNRNWGSSTVVRILRNEAYAGTWYFYKHVKCEPTDPHNRVENRRSPKSSNRLRPRTEWLPLELPESLRTVPREMWERVQRQLNQNRTFSPRNSKHSYLLRGLVRCGGCGARYVGHPGHGRFYYRCLARCKNPTIKDKDLDAAVWGAVEEAVLNPRLILESVEKLNLAQTSDVNAQRDTMIEAEKSLRQMETEESRLLEAYRLNVISASQLGRELEKLNSRRAFLETQKTNPSADSRMLDLTAAKASVSEFCRLIIHRLKTFTMEERQRFLRSLVNEVIFDGSAVKIRGIIPLHRDQQDGLADGRTARNAALLTAGEIASTDSASYGRNLTWPAKAPAKRESMPILEFVIEKPVLRSDERKRDFALKNMAA